jgi:hypothetical protein
LCCNFALISTLGNHKTKKMASHLELLPTEILCDIIRVLDPVGLLSLSQTSSRLRFIIKPNRSHVLQRLLALETRPEFCSSYHYDFDTHEVIPEWNSLQWARMRFACSECLRLLPHTSFDKKYIVRPVYMKPHPGSPPTNMYTIWEPSSCDKRRRKNRAKEYLKEYGYQGVGHKRHQRKCNECRFQKGKINPQVNGWHYMLGTTVTPIVKSRYVKFPCRLDRWFPELASALQIEQPDCVTTTSADYPYLYDEKQCWMTFMVRCSGCERWQEVKAFRARACGHPLMQPRGPASYVEWSRDTEPLPRNTMYNHCSEQGCHDIDASCCNSCFAQQYGRLALGLALADWLKRLLESELCNLQSISFRWHPRSPSLRDISQQYRSEVKKMWKVRNPRGLGLYDKWTRADIRSAANRYRRFQEILRLSEEERQIEDPTFTMPLDTDRDFDAWEASWLWYQDCLDKLDRWEQVEDLLEEFADSVLNYDPAADAKWFADSD